VAEKTRHNLTGFFMTPFALPLKKLFFTAKLIPSSSPSRILRPLLRAGLVFGPGTPLSLRSSG